MNVQYGEVFKAGGAMHAVVVRSEGVFVRPADGVLAESDEAGAEQVRPTTGDETHMVVLPEGSLGIEMTEPMKKQFVVRLPKGSMISIQPTAARISVTRVEGGAEVENTTKMKIGVGDLTELDSVRRTIDRLTRSQEAHRDVGGARVALVSEHPAALGIPSFPYQVHIKFEQGEMDFAMIQAFVLPPGTPGIVDGRRTVALVRGEPLVMTELSDAYCRHCIQTSMRAPMQGAPPEILAIFEKVVPPLFADFCTIAEAIGPVHSVWSSRPIEEAWKRLDAAAAGGGKTQG